MKRQFIINDDQITGLIHALIYLNADEFHRIINEVRECPYYGG
jgi:hypothetical protein